MVAGAAHRPTASGLYATRADARRGAQAEVWDNFSDAANGPRTFPMLGGAWEMFGGNVGATATPRVAAGALTFAPPGGGAGYAQLLCDQPVTRIGGRFTLSAQTTATGSAVLATWGAELSTTWPALPDAAIHLPVTATGWTFDVWEGGSKTNLASGQFAAPLTTDGATVHTVEVVLDRAAATAYTYLPDGSTAVVTDSRLGTLESPWACWEMYRIYATDSIAGWVETWADSGSGVAVSEAARFAAVPTAPLCLTYSPGGASDVVVPPSGALVDATNLVLPDFTAPASGRILVTLHGYLAMTATASVYWGILNNGSTLLFTTPVVGQQFTGMAHLSRVVNVTPGAVYSLGWRHVSTVASVATMKLNGPAGLDATMTMTPLG